jgi:hypothetical protein
MNSSAKFMSELHSLAEQSSKFAINPDDLEEFIIDDKVAIEMSAIPGKDNYVHFVSIRALQSGKKHGSVAMKKVFQLVDDNNIILLGRILPYHTKDVSKDDLRKWYIKFSCKPMNPSNEDGLWVRFPNENKSLAISIDPLTKFKIEKGFSDADFSDRVKFVKFISLAIAIVLSVCLLRSKTNFV